jgi:hypothetical protein
MVLDMSWGQPKAAAQEIEARPTIPMALEHVEAVDVAFDRARTPGECHPGFDRGIVLAAPLGKSWQGLQGTLGGALQPGIERLRLPLAHELRNVLCEVDGLRHFGLLCVSRGQLLALGLGAYLRVPEHQPGCPTRRQGLVGGLHHNRQCLPRAAVPESQALGLT